MGHTIPAKRMIIYARLNNLKGFAETLREPYRTRFVELIKLAYRDISSIVYANSFDDEEMIVYAMLFELSKKNRHEVDDKIIRCLAIMLSK